MKRTYNCNLGTESVELYFDNEALFVFEEHHGKPAHVVLASGELGARAITHLVYAGMLHKPEQRVPLDSVKRMIQMNRYPEIATTLAQALNAAFDTGTGAGGGSHKPSNPGGTEKNVAAD